MFVLIRMKMLDHIFSLVLCLINMGCQSTKIIFHGPRWKAKHGDYVTILNKHQGLPCLTLRAVGPNMLGREHIACPRAPGLVLGKEGAPFSARAQPHSRLVHCVSTGTDLQVQPRSLTGRTRFIISLYCISHIAFFIS